MIADGDRISRQMLKFTLNEWQYEVVAAGDGAETMRILRSEDAPQIVILDWDIPKIEGAEVCRKIRSLFRLKPLYLILLMARRAQEDIVAGLEAGADDCLTKPYYEAELRAKIRAGERILRLQNGLSARAAELEAAFKVGQQSEAMLRASLEKQQLLETAVEQADVSIVITTAELDLPGPEILFVNPAFTQITGYTAAEAIGNTPRMLQGAKTDREQLARLRTTLEEGRKFFGAAINYRKDGEPYDLEWNISPVKNQNGQITHFISVQNDVTERNRIAAMLRDAREYQNLFNLANDSILVYAPEDQIVLTVNDKACETYGIERAGFIGMSLRYLSQNPARDLEMLKILLANNSIEEFETVHQRADGSLINLLINSSVVEYEGRQAILSIHRDITERRLAEENVRLAKQEWSETVDAISDLIIVTDRNGEIRRCNNAAVDFFRLSPAEFIGRKLDQMLFGTIFIEHNLENETTRYNPLRQSLWEGQINFGNSENSNERWFEITNHKVRLSQPETDGWVHIITDITARKVADAALRRLDTAIEQAADSVIISNLNGLVEYVNPSFEAMTGWQQTDVVGQPLANFKPELFGAGQLSEAIFECLAEGKSWHGVYKTRRQNGEIYLEETTFSPVKDRHGNPLNYVAVCRDITEKRRLESIAEAVNMMDNVGYIFSGIRHELGNPINSIKTALAVLRKNVDNWQREQIATYVERCQTETTRVEYLLRSLKTFSMHENPRMKPLALTVFMREFVALVETDFAKRGVQISFAESAESGNVLCDQRALHQIMLNLMINAADALDERDDKQIIVSLERDARRFYISIQDNGAGMSEQQLDNLFKPFYTSKPDGTGLGLVIVKKMLIKMNGTIEFSSQLNVGTTARLTLEAENKFTSG